VELDCDIIVAEPALCFFYRVTVWDTVHGNRHSASYLLKTEAVNVTTEPLLCLAFIGT
jgi:hypothetical protein